MAILKFINSVNDFDNDGLFLDFGGITDITRLDNGYFWDKNESLAASWPEPVGSTVWVHFRFLQSRNATSWDDFGIFRFYDADNNLVMSLDITYQLNKWDVHGGSSGLASTVARYSLPHTIDLEFVKNGTTDLTLTVYYDGMQRATVTVTNAVDRGVPVSFNTVNVDLDPGTCYMSEMVIADEDTRGWRLRQHSPISHGKKRDWEGPVTGVIDNRKNTGIYSDTLDAQAAFGIARTKDVPTGVIVEKVVQQSSLMRGATGLASFNHFFEWESNTVVNSADVAVALDQRNYITEHPTSPDTTVGWVSSEFPSLQSGVRART